VNFSVHLRVSKRGGGYSSILTASDLAFLRNLSLLGGDKELMSTLLQVKLQPWNLDNLPHSQSHPQKLCWGASKPW
jgi:hypothetical protein